MSAILNANNMARASAEKMDEPSGNRLIDRQGHGMAAEATFVQAFEPSVYVL